QNSRSQSQLRNEFRIPT
ncbi:unnamed protein product, partial [Rotaria magnacalcarata]